MFSNTTKESAAATANDVRNTVYNAKNDVRNVAESVKGDLSDAAHHAGRKVRHFIGATNLHLHEATDKVAGEIRTNPVRSSMIALGVGVILGALLRR